MVENFKVTAIVDWESSGFFPPEYELGTLRAGLVNVTFPDWFVFIKAIMEPVSQEMVNKFKSMRIGPKRELLPIGMPALNRYYAKQKIYESFGGKNTRPPGWRRPPPDAPGRIWSTMTALG